jgi:hypothetical protein
MKNEQNSPAVAGPVELRVIRLPWDVSRCTGENNRGECAARHDCLRHIEFDNAGPLTLKFEAPTDAPLSMACELVVLYNAKLTSPPLGEFSNGEDL